MPSVPSPLIETLRRMHAPIMITHVVPDADAVGASCAMAIAWASQECHPKVSLPDGSLSQRLAQIARITRCGSYSPILRAMLSLMAIRNEGVHLGLQHFDHVKIINMIRILSLASLMIWKAR